jgi:hypothetical protein
LELYFWLKKSQTVPFVSGAFTSEVSYWYSSWERKQNQASYFWEMKDNQTSYS